MFDEEQVLCGIILLVKVNCAENKIDEGDHINDLKKSLHLIKTIVIIIIITILKTIVMMIMTNQCECEGVSC